MTDKQEELLAKFADAADEDKARVHELIASLLGDADETKGGPGSGNFGHEGRPGEVGGSAPGGGDGGGDSFSEAARGQITVEEFDKMHLDKEKVDRLDESHNLYWEDLTRDQEGALEDYTEGKNRDFNRLLRENPSIDLTREQNPNLLSDINNAQLPVGVTYYELRQAEEIHRAIADAPKHEPMTVFRSAKGNVSNLKEGMTIRLPGFQSTSPRLAIPIRVFADAEGENLFKIRAKHGLFIGNNSATPGEDEYLIDHNQRFKVVSVRKATFRVKKKGSPQRSMTVVELEQL